MMSKEKYLQMCAAHSMTAQIIGNHRFNDLILCCAQFLWLCNELNTAVWEVQSEVKPGSPWVDPASLPCIWWWIAVECQKEAVPYRCWCDSQFCFLHFFYIPFHKSRENGSPSFLDFWVLGRAAVSSLLYPSPKSDMQSLQWLICGPGQNCSRSESDDPGTFVCHSKSQIIRCTLLWSYMSHLPRLCPGDIV